MKILHKSNFIFDFLKEQEVNKNIQYIESPYLIKEEDMIYNGLTNEVVLIEDKEKDKEKLIKKWFYLPPSFNIEEILQNIKKNYNYLNKSFLLGKRTFIIFTTTACNAKCPYCFEKGMPAVSMSKQRALDVAKYIIKNSYLETDPIKITWFGGQPLVNKQAINIIIKELIKNNRTFYSEIISNGDLFNTISDQEINLWNIEGIQFTIDNIKSQYDIIKGLPQGAYQRLKNTIHRFEQQNINITIRIHMGPSSNNIQDCKKIINEFKNYKNVNMYVNTLYEEKLHEQDFQNLLKIEKYLISINKMNLSLRLYDNPYQCMADNRRISCITPQGFLAYCEHFPNENLYGTIYNKKFDKTKLKQWLTKVKDINNKCKQCVFYPSCSQLINCPTRRNCEDGYLKYQIERVKEYMKYQKKILNFKSGENNNG